MSRPQSWVRHFVWLLAACAWAESQADLAVIRQMRVHAANAKHVRILHRSQVDPDLDAVILFGAPEAWLIGTEHHYWEREKQIGVFLQKRSDPGLIYKIIVAAGRPDGDCQASVQRVTPCEIVIRCKHEKGNGADNHKFVYDIRAKGLLGHFTVEAVPFADVVGDGKRTILTGWDLEKPTAIEYMAGANPPFRVLSQREAASWIKRIPAAKILSRYVGAIFPPRFEPVSFGPDGRFSIRLRPVKGPNGPAGIVAVHERTGRTAKWFSLPQSTYDEFSAARPRKVEGGCTRRQTTIEESIGPWQIVDGTLWIGKAFYDGEGMSGVGGFGHFDTESREFVIHSPEQIRDSSVSAILVESDCIWLGLFNRGEWGSTGVGVVQVTQSGRVFGRIVLKEPVGGIARVEGGLLMATDFGVALFDGSRVRRFFIDQTSAGRLRVVEAIPGKYTSVE